MEPITVITSALALAPAVLKPASDQAVKDAYAAFKSLILRKFGPKNPELEPTLAAHAENPGGHEAQARELLVSVAADRDQEVMALATELLRLLERARPGISGGLVGQINAEKVNVIEGNVGTINM